MWIWRSLGLEVGVNDPNTLYKIPKELIKCYILKRCVCKASSRVELDPVNEILANDQLSWFHGTPMTCVTQEHWARLHGRTQDQTEDCGPWCHRTHVLPEETRQTQVRARLVWLALWSFWERNGWFRCSWYPRLEIYLASEFGKSLGENEHF